MFFRGNTWKSYGFPRENLENHLQMMVVFYISIYWVELLVVDLPPGFFWRRISPSTWDDPRWSQPANSFGTWSKQRLGRWEIDLFWWIQGEFWMGYGMIWLWVKGMKQFWMVKCSTSSWWIHCDPPWRRIPSLLGWDESRLFNQVEMNVAINHIPYCWLYMYNIKYNVIYICNIISNI